MKKVICIDMFLIPKTMMKEICNEKKCGLGSSIIVCRYFAALQSRNISSIDFFLSSLLEIILMAKSIDCKMQQ